MNRDDYRRAVDHIKIDEGMKKRLEQRCMTKRKGGFKLYQKVAVGAAALLLIVGLTMFIPKDDIKPQTMEQPHVTAEGMPAVQKLFSGFQVVAYAAGAEGDTLSGDYQTETTATIITPDVEALLPTYSPLMSSVPGFPFAIQFVEPQGEERMPDRIEVTIDGGSLCTWNQATSVVEDKGDAVSLEQSTTLYWSPLSMNSEAKQTTMTITAKYGDETVDKQIIVIKRIDDMGNYKVAGE